MRTETLVRPTHHDNPDTQDGYSEMKSLFKTMDATKRARYVTNALVEFATNENLNSNAYLQGVFTAINEELTNLSTNGLYNV